MARHWHVDNDHKRECFKKFVDEICNEHDFVTFICKTSRPRTPKQQAALEVYFRNAAGILNDAGYYHQLNAEFLRDAIEIPWTQESFKEFWRSIQNTMYGVSSTTDIESDKVSEVYDAINLALSERTGIHIPFPSKSMTDE